jgi:hypothetical protein
MQLITIISSISAVFLFAALANAEPLAGRGLGLSSCGEFAQMYQADPKGAEVAFSSWAQGFMTGYNFAQEDNTYRDLGARTFAQMQSDIRQYCDRHPLGSYLDAVGDFLAKLPVLQSKPK